MSEIVIHNTLSGVKEKLIPVKEGKVGIYCCGPTTYNYIHIGNGRPLVVFDTIRRYLDYQGYEVNFVSNFTDVDDKIISRAAHEGEEARELAGHYIEEYFRDADALGVLRADVYPKVSEHIPEIIAFVEDLIQKGIAYPIDGDVYYSIERFPGYGKLSKRSRDDLLDGARVDVDQRKQSPGDFALWKTAKPGEPSWESPWGSGRPGWHIECSAMSHKYLGESFDIHGGGADLIFPHHENEIAQSEGRFGKPMAKYWIHNGFITINQEKMSKSKGNFFLLRDVLRAFSGQVIRFYLLSVHYRSPLDFDDEKLTVAQRGLDRLKNAARNATAFIEENKKARSGDNDFGAGNTDAEASGQAAAFLKAVAAEKTQFEGAMNDDFNTALAIAALFDLVRTMNAYTAEIQSSALDLPANIMEEKKAFLAKTLKTGLEQFLMLADILGLDLLDSGASAEDERELNRGLEALLLSLGEQTYSGRMPEENMDALLRLRQTYRKVKNYTGADEIRDALLALGIAVEDTPQGSRWYSLK